MIFFTKKINIRSLSTVMSNLAYRYLIFLILFISIYSCHKNDDFGPSPSFEIMTDTIFNNGSATISPGELMNFEFFAEQGGQKLTNFFIEVEPIDGDIYRLYDTALYCSEFIWEGSFYKSSELAERWMFTIQDRQGRRVGDMLYIYADTNSAYNPLQIISDIDLGAQNNTDYGSFFSLQNQQSYFTEQAKEGQEFIDMVFYLGEDEMTLACPAANIESGIFPSEYAPDTWEIRNTTRYIKTSLTNEEFDAAQNDSILIANYIDADGKRKAKNLQSGNVVVFKDQQGLLGMFRVNYIDNIDDGTLNMDIKIQQLAK